MVNLPKLPTGQQPITWDIGINGVGFLRGQSVDYPYLRETAESRTQQIDTSNEAGEQSLQNWWQRSQSSFDLGAGARFNDVKGDASLARRYWDSENVDTITTPGTATLLNRYDKMSSSTATNQKLLGVNNNDSNLALWAEGTNLWLLSASAVAVAVNYSAGDVQAQILDIATNGSQYFVLTTTGLYGGATPGSAGFKIFDVTATRGKVQWAKDRLFVVVNNKIYAIPANQPTGAAVNISTITPVGEMKPNEWTCTALVDSPKGVILAGYTSGSKGGFWFIGAESNGAGGITLTAPVTAGELPYGEVPRAFDTYMSSYLLIGTNLGVRSGTLDVSTSTTDTLNIGPLIVQTESIVYAVAGYGNFFFSGGMKQKTGNSGLYKFALGRQTADGTFFPYQKDAVSDAVGNASSIAFGGQSNQLMFTVNGSGVYKDAGVKASTGFIETSRIRFGTTEQKIFQYLRVNNNKTPGSVSVTYATDDTDFVNTLYSWDTNIVSEANFDGSDAEPHSWLSYRINLTSAGNSSPTITGYTAKAQPSGVQQRIIRETLLCSLEERTAQGLLAPRRSTYERISELERLENKGAVLVWEDNYTGEQHLVQIDKIQFIQTIVAKQNDNKNEPEGLLMVTFRTVDNAYIRTV